MSRVSGVAELIRSTLLRGEVEPGGRLIEPKLAQRFGTTRPTVREALRRLEGEGLLVSDDDGGMRLVAFAERELAETLQLRDALEQLSVRLAAESATAYDLARLRALDGHADRHFHRAVAALAGNLECVRALDAVWDKVVIATAHGLLEPRACDRKAILAALQSGQPSTKRSSARSAPGAASYFDRSVIPSDASTSSSMNALPVQVAGSRSRTIRAESA